MDEFKVGDRVRLIPLLLNTGNQPDYGTVLRFVGEDIDVAWDNGPKRSLHLASRLQLAKPPSQLVFYVREITALQAALTKRNATIGRLRAANRGLRRERDDKKCEAKYFHDEHAERMREKVELNYEIDRLKKRIVELEHRREPQAPMIPPGTWKEFNSAPPKQPVEPTPLPTVSPRVGGVYRTRDGREAECRGESDSDTFPFWMHPRFDACDFTVTSQGARHFHVASGYDLVAEISPPPEPAFTGPLEVGGWYEDEKDRVCQCTSAQLRIDGTIQFCCVRVTGFDLYRANGRTFSGNGPRIIRKVDPPGGES